MMKALFNELTEENQDLLLLLARTISIAQTQTNADCNSTNNKAPDEEEIM